jgi:hypothetical protein
MAKTVEVTQETDSGRNRQFHDDRNGRDMSRAEFVRQIRKGNYPDYHVRIINGLATPISNPDRSENNNLG